ncbi:hypothetical protein EYF80_008126 [Liparis tanakae]|uniref:Uncharacterized protein n=1 Tax=Liparis tanakae TaxID=230148 RepID=A0A4Z2IUM1_9TELE|nr:hypothetical protein EYF80_008126 [Liparis tanakae]
MQRHFIQLCVRSSHAEEHSTPERGRYLGWAVRVTGDVENRGEEGLTRGRHRQGTPSIRRASSAQQCTATSPLPPAPSARDRKSKHPGAFRGNGSIHFPQSVMRSELTEAVFWLRGHGFYRRSTPSQGQTHTHMAAWSSRKVPASIPARPISPMSETLDSQWLPGCFTAAHRSLSTKDGSTAEKNLPMGIK